MKPLFSSSARRGSAMIEFALVSIVLVPIFVAVFQFGYTFYVYNLLCTQIRAGARFASLRTFRCADPASIEKFKTAVANMVRFGDPDGKGALIEPGLPAGAIDVRIKDKYGADADASHAPAYVIVTTADYRVDAVFKTFKFDGKPSLQFPYVGQYAPAGTEP